MSLKTIVKVSHLSNLSDARYCAGMGVEMLGFRVIPGQKYYMRPEVFQDIRGWISGPKIVAELYGITDRTQIDSAVQTYAPDYFELSYEEYKIYGSFLTLPSIVYFHQPAGVRSLLPEERISYILVDEHARCSHVPPSTFPVLSKTGSLEALKNVLSEKCFKGCALEGPEESRPGLTNYEQLGVLLETLEED